MIQCSPSLRTTGLQYPVNSALGSIESADRLSYLVRGKLRLGCRSFVVSDPLLVRRSVASVGDRSKVGQWRRRRKTILLKLGVPAQDQLDIEEILRILKAIALFVAWAKRLEVVERLETF